MNQAVQGDGTKREPVTVADWESELSAFGSLFADFERDGDDQGHQTWSRMHDARLALAKRIVALATGANPVAETGALGEPDAWLVEFDDPSAFPRRYSIAYTSEGSAREASSLHYAKAEVVPLYRRATASESEGGV